MEADEDGTLAALKMRRREVLGPLVSRHQGRVFKVAGDSVLVEFASAVNAVQCAVDLQQAMAAANLEQPEERRIVLRIGVNLGDVMVEGNDPYGDGVNIAARLEGIADPGSMFPRLLSKTQGVILFESYRFALCEAWRNNQVENDPRRNDMIPLLTTAYEKALTAAVDEAKSKGWENRNQGMTIQIANPTAPTISVPENKPRAFNKEQLQVPVPKQKQGQQPA